MLAVNLMKEMVISLIELMEKNPFSQPQILGIKDFFVVTCTRTE